MNALIAGIERVAVTAAIAVAGLCVTHDALSDASPAAVQAEALFRRGNQAFDAGKYEAARQLFHESNQLGPSRGTLLNEALCEEKLGKVAAAARHLREVASQFEDDKKRQAVALEHLRSVEPRVPHLSLHAPTPLQAGLRVALDDEAVNVEHGADVPVEVGPHTVVVTAPARVEWRKSVSVAEGDYVDVTLELGAAEAGEPHPSLPLSSSSASSGRRTAAWITGGFAVAALGVGGVTGALALAKHADVASKCPNPDRCTVEAVGVASDGQTLSVVSTVAFGVALASAGGAVYLFLTSSAPKPPSQTALQPWLGAGCGGVVASGSW